MNNSHSRYPRFISVRIIGVIPLLAGALPVSVVATDLDEVVVVGQGIGSMRLDAPNQAGSRLGLTALQTPASVGTITSEEISTKGDYDALSAVTRAAGISADANPGNGGTSVSARGFNGPDSIVTNYDGTRLYVTAGTVTFPADTWTIDHVEVLHGAGSVINGLGAIGATINYVPKAPKPGATSFDAVLAVGSFDKTRVALGGGADLSHNCAFRLDGVHQKSDSNVDRNTERRDVAAGSLLFGPSENFSMKLSVDYADIKEDSPYFGTPTSNGQASDALRKQNFNFGDGFLEYKDIRARVRTEWKMSANATFRNDTYLLNAKRQWQNLENYFYNSATGLIDRDGYSYYGIKHDQQQLGTRADVLLESAFGSMKNIFTVGGDVNSIDLKYHNNWNGPVLYGDTISSANASVPLFGWKPDTLADANTPTVHAFTTDTTQYGLFFDDVLALNPKWSVVLGARYDNIDYSRTNLAIYGNPQISFDSKYAEWSWRGGLVYQPRADMSLYAQYSRATDPVTSPTTMGASSKNFDPTRGRQVEVGFKQQLMGGKAEYTLAWFDIKKTGLVTQRAVNSDPEQIGAQSSRGLEATLRVNPTATLSLDMNAAWVDAKYDEYYSEVNGAQVSFGGNTPKTVPDLTANAWVNWTLVDALNMGAGVRYVASRFANDANTRELPAYTVVDAQAGWKFTERTQVTMLIRNVTDEKNYVLSEYAPNQWIFGDPRSYEVNFKYKL